MNLTNVNKFFVMISMAVFGTNMAYAESPAICQQIAKEKHPVAYLLDAKGNIIEDAVNLGSVAYKYQNTGHFTIPTDYKIVLAPARLQITNCRADCLVLKEVAPMCKNAKTYSVSYVMTDRNSPADQGWLPWKLDESAGVFVVEDPSSDYDVVVNYKFKPRVTGELYNPKK
ncbi:hypothetical protein [Duganella sp. CF458]|uniref:hypothetical protein n=1 Tax=Duganella sp. CF458 TaxID=1884368 RepID=UPI000B85551A|nr:hypothetical protein [Duganella sp. CF458]